MQIVDFTHDHIEAAVQLAKQNYKEERGFVPVLPPVDRLPDLKLYVENGLGVTAFEGDTMIGFLCSVPPFKNAFRSTDATGVFSPMGANGAIGENRAKIYARLYQAAGEKWVRAGASSHAVCLYAHDREVQEQFFRYGFGLRCVDAIRGMDEIIVPPCEGYSFSELAPKEILDILPLENMLDESYIDSPFFMFRAKESEAVFLKKYEHFQSVYFTAKYEGRIVAFVRAELDGENFICNTPGYLHVKGAYCLPEHRGKGLNQKLLSMLIQKLKTKGYTRLGVDFESINPTAYGFWLKYFDAYTHSVVRRIDEKILEVLRMQLHAIPLNAELVSFVDRVYEQNRAVLHGNIIPIEEWHSAFGDDADPYEVNFIIMADNQPAAWLKIHGLNKEKPSISMLVVEDFFKRCGVGSFAIHFAEEYIKRLGKSSLLIFTTKDNEPAAQCYLKNGYKIVDEIQYAVGDSIIRPGYKFQKDIVES